jgi:ATPase subunit of ABC transporter with duplicated ATPase domains
MATDEIIVRFEDVSHAFGPNRPILDEASFSIRRGMKMTLMGQNGAGKSTLFKLLTGEIEPEEGEIVRFPKLSIALGRQVIPREKIGMTVREFFESMFDLSAGRRIYDIDPRIDEVLEIVNFKGHTQVHDRIIGSFSGGQQARLLLASALIQDPDLLLLDEPTNNLDKAGIEHLRDFIKNYDKTVVVISHDADFLNSFTQGVIYLDVRSHKVEQYAGNYFDVLREITARVERENMKNAQLEKKIAASKEKMNFFAQKGGKMRLVAKKMRDQIAESEEDIVDVRQEDKTIKPFKIQAPENLVGEILTITSYKTMGHPSTGSTGSPQAGLGASKPVTHKKMVILKKRMHLLLAGPNGIGKSTLLESIANQTAEGIKVKSDIKIGYYRQDFSNMDFNATVADVLYKAMEKPFEEKMRATAAGFLIGAELINQKIGNLSEGQKGLVAFARLVLMKPALLILDEPTNHMNFRHLPIIAKALDEYEGAMILVSHVPEFVRQIRIDETLDLAK